MNCEPIECPICYECIGSTNNITTECGHKFHASCLMTNITRNGFSCPCCRTLMAEHSEQEEDDDDSTLLDDDSDDDSDDDDDVIGFSDNEDALRGLRLFTNLLEGVEHDQEDVVAEYQYVQQREELRSIPTLEVVAAALRAQGVTYEHLLANALMEHSEYENNMDELDRRTNDLWGKMRIFISNYIPEPAPVAEVETPIAAAFEEEHDDWVQELETICRPIPVAEGEMFQIELIDDDFDFTIEDVDDICVNLAEHMDEVDYRSQPKMPLIHV